MIALSRPSRTVAAVSRRVELAKALRLVAPQMSADAIGAELGMSGGMVRLYLRGGVKRFDRRPVWAEKFFAAAAALAYGEETKAGEILAALAVELKGTK